jgi:hypothetical protein
MAQVAKTPQPRRGCREPPARQGVLQDEPGDAPGMPPGELERGAPAGRDAEDDHLLELQAVEQLGERVGEGLGAPARGGRRVPVPGARGDEQSEAVIAEEALVPEGRVAVGVPAVEH